MTLNIRQTANLVKEVELSNHWHHFTEPGYGYSLERFSQDLYSLFTLDLGFPNKTGSRPDFWSDHFHYWTDVIALHNRLEDLETELPQYKSLISKMLSISKPDLPNIETIDIKLQLVPFNSQEQYACLKSSDQFSWLIDLRSGRLEFSPTSIEYDFGPNYLNISRVMSIRHLEGSLYHIEYIEYETPGTARYRPVHNPVRHMVLTVRRELNMPHFTTTDQYVNLIGRNREWAWCINSNTGALEFLGPDQLSTPEYAGSIRMDLIEEIKPINLFEIVYLA